MVAKVFTSQTDIDGNYTAELRVATDLFAQSLVTAVGEGIDNQAGVELISQVGTFADLVQRAGNDGTLTSSEEPRLIVWTLQKRQRRYRKHLECISHDLI